MLKALTIQNLATIERLTVEFAPGLNALTGETGAGKSILVGGLELALGERAAGEAIRAGEGFAVAEAVFAGPPPPDAAAMLRGELELECPGEREVLVLRRELSRAGRNRCFVGERMVGVA
ncbi:MAG: AAA family ATPase, partial [bacterium]|nr:AAA family ATPase [bacterium]